MDYFYTDPHDKHNAEFIFKNRGFPDMVSHDICLIDGINYTVKPEDTLWILGDISWEDPVSFLRKIKCENVQIVRGNHDNNLYNINKKLIPSNVHLNDTLIEIKVNMQSITLCHYPMISWNKSHYNTWLLYGHVHQKKFPFTGKMIDVSPTAEHMFPYSFEEIKIMMDSLPNNWDYVPPKFLDKKEI